MCIKHNRRNEGMLYSVHRKSVKIKHKLMPAYIAKFCTALYSLHIGYISKLKAVTLNMHNPCKEIGCVFVVVVKECLNAFPC